MQYQFGTEAIEHLEKAIRELEQVGYIVGFYIGENDDMATELFELQRAVRNFKSKHADSIKSIDNK